MLAGVFFSKKHVYLHTLKDSTAANWAFISFSYLDRCRELQQDPTLSSQEREERETQWERADSLIQIIHAHDAQWASVHIQD